jgi:hypothetical protein
MKTISRSAGLLFAVLMLISAALMSACSSSSSSSNDEPYYTGRYHLFAADSATLEPEDNGSFTLELAGSVEAAWIKEKTGDLVYDEEDPQELIGSIWDLQYGSGTPNAIILVEDAKGGVQGYFVSLSDPAYSPSGITFDADWIGGTETGITPPSEAVEFTDMVLLLCNEEDDPNLETEEIPDNAAAAVPVAAADVVPVYTTTGTGTDPMVAVAFANINFSEAIGQVLANKTADMQSTINIMNTLEGNKNIIRGIENKIGSNQMPDDTDKANLTALGFSGFPSCSDMSSVDCKNSWLEFLSCCMDTISAQVQQYTQGSQLQMIMLQQLLQNYNSANQNASNLISSIGMVTKRIAGNIGR